MGTISSGSCLTIGLAYAMPDRENEALPASMTGLVEAYQMAAHELEQVQRLPWRDLEPCENAPWRFGAGDIARLDGAHGRMTIVHNFEGDPATKQIIVALEWQHERQGRRTVRLVTLVSNHPS